MVVFKGNYSTINGWLDGDHLAFAVDRTSYWKVFFKVFEKPKNVEILCLHYEGILIPVKN